MKQVEAALRRAVRDLTELDVRFCVVGGLAVGVRALQRTTRDVDLAISTERDADA